MTLGYSDFFAETDAAFFDWQWTPAFAALKRARTHFSDEEANQEIAKHLRSGVIRAQAKRAFVTWVRYLSLGSGINLKNAEDRIYRQSFLAGGRKTFDNCQIPNTFWGASSKDREWQGTVGFIDQAYWADWKRAEFAEIAGRSTDGEPADFIYCLRAYGVEFAAGDIDALFPANERETTEKNGRPEKFDWARAFAAVSGKQIKQDFLPDLYVNGAQAALATELASWFSLQIGVEPSSTALKEKAKILLSEWQTADKK